MTCFNSEILRNTNNSYVSFEGGYFLFSLKPLSQKQHNCDIMMHFKVFYYYDILSIFCCNGLLCLLRFLLNYTATITGNTYKSSHQILPMRILVGLMVTFTRIC